MLAGAKQIAAPSATCSSIFSTLSFSGSFRTGLAGASLSQSEPIPGCEETVGPFRTSFPDSDGLQPGDPAKAAAAILAALESDEPPLRLALGNGSADLLGAELEGQLAEFKAWEPVTRGTDFG